MIQPNELRVGNILNYTTDEDGLFTTTIDWEDIKYCIEKNKDFNRHYSPIPLTEEVLLKCGFEREKETIENIDFIKDDSPYWVQWVAVGDYFVLFGGGNSLGISIKSLHQLQNLFFALTGKELEYRASN
jgi:hypothetical protein